MHNILHLGLRSVQFSFRNKIYRKHLKCLRYISQKVETEKKVQTFDEVISDRRNEAKRSIVIQVNSEKSFPELYNYCTQFGQIQDAQHYKITPEEFHYILIEFENEEIANEAINSSCFNEDFPGIPVRSPFLWFRAGKQPKLKQNDVKNPKDLSEKKLKVIDGVRPISNNELRGLLQTSENLEDQIKILYNSTCLNDLEIRLRFLAARQVETSILGMFPYANARPFGSSVNGFGKMGCDLDLILRFEEEQSPNLNYSRFIFHTKENLNNGRSQTQRQMESIGDMLHLFLPGVCHVRRILQARVPIIKFHHEHLNLEVDLSMSNLTGVYMSELFYMFGQIDPRVRPFIFCVRRWAETVGLTNPSPGRWITNFSLTCLIIFFLQQLKSPILPPINLFVKSATSSDLRVTEDGINCTYLRNYNNLNFKTNNKNSISDLLLQFFEFYSQFDFNNKAVSLNEGRAVMKPDHSAIYILNPLEQVLNVSKNISLEECERLRIEVRNAAWILDTEIDKNAINEQGDTVWGLLNLFKTPESAIIRPNMFFKPRMVEVTDLFDKENIQSTKEKQPEIEYKNSMVRNQVQNIRSKTKSNLKQIRMNAIAGDGKGIGRRR